MQVIKQPEQEKSRRLTETAEEREIRLQKRRAADKRCREEETQSNKVLELRENQPV